MLPLVILVCVAVAGASLWIVNELAHPAQPGYFVTPEKYGMLSARGAQITDETWTNRDGTISRGWLLRGSENAPAVILLHRYGADRSHVLNLGVKLNEATDFTVLMPDLRGHGQSPAVQYTDFGGAEGEDALAAMLFLKDQKTPNGVSLTNGRVGVYGLELGSLAALNAAAQDQSIVALALDSVPSDSQSLLGSAVGKRFPFMSTVTSRFGELGSFAYYYEGGFSRRSACDLARGLEDKKVLLLGGVDAPDLQDSTNKLSKCFPQSSKAEVRNDLSPSGLGIINASLDIAAAYDQRVIDFFRNSLNTAQ